MNRQQIASLMYERLESEKRALQLDFFRERRINSAYIDNLLPEDLALSIYNAFPNKADMVSKKTIREYKYVGVQMNRYNPLLEEAIYAFQDKRIMAIISEITKISDLLPDEHLYAGGISLMDKGCFLNPHLDNSHDRDRTNYRVLNLLYYVTPNWVEANGGSFELWDGGPKSRKRTIVSKFNRLVVMVTNRASWHSVNPVLADANRCCVSNYYFSSQSVDAEDYFHVTSFRGRPEEGFKDLFLRGDILFRSAIRKIFKKGLVKTQHIYKK